MFLISWSFTVIAIALASLIYKYVGLKGKAGDWGDGFKSAYFQLALRSLRSLGGTNLPYLILVLFFLVTSCLYNTKSLSSVMQNLPYLIGSLLKLNGPFI